MSDAGVPKDTAESEQEKICSGQAVKDLLSTGVHQWSSKTIKLQSLGSMYKGSEHERSLTHRAAQMSIRKTAALELIPRGSALLLLYF